MDSHKQVDNSNSVLKKVSEEERLARNSILVPEGTDSFERMTFDEVFERCKKVVLMTKGIAVRALYEKGMTEGRSIEEVRSKIQELGISYRTMVQELPPEAKQQQHHVKSRPNVTNNAKVAKSAILTSGKERPSLQETIPRPVRIVMTAAKFSGLSKYMDDFRKKNGDDKHYVIEYDLAAKELYVDLAEKDEEPIPD